MTATALVDDHYLDYLDDHTDGFDYELLAAIDPESLVAAGRPQLTVLEGGRSFPAANSDRGGASAQALATRRESELVEVYRRRRFLAALVVTGIVVALAWAAGISVTSFGAAPVQTNDVPTVHVVSIGDTYPSIATELGADDPAAFAETLRAANGGAELSPGQRLVVNLATMAS